MSSVSKMSSTVIFDSFIGGNLTQEIMNNQTDQENRLMSVYDLVSKDKNFRPGSNHLSHCCLRYLRFLLTEIIFDYKYSRTESVEVELSRENNQR